MIYCFLTAGRCVCPPVYSSCLDSGSDPTDSASDFGSVLDGTGGESSSVSLLVEIRCVFVFSHYKELKHEVCAHTHAHSFIMRQ